MKKKKIYILKMRSKEFCSHLQYCFYNKPTESEVIEIIKEELSHTRDKKYREFLERCMLSIDIYKIPILKDNMYENAVYWKHKIDSLYNSRGLTQIKSVVIYLNEQ
ncbi:MAG: hypothetical protein RBR68_13620 [Tenuifilaceae bacterium]|nr:hypothetical protein [Tenuifilaceae bacterium]